MKRVKKEMNRYVIKKKQTKLFKVVYMGCEMNENTKFSMKVD